MNLRNLMMAAETAEEVDYDLSAGAIVAIVLSVLLFTALIITVTLFAAKQRRVWRVQFSSGGTKIVAFYAIFYAKLTVGDAVEDEILSQSLGRVMLHGTLGGEPVKVRIEQRGMKPPAVQCSVGGRELAAESIDKVKWKTASV